MFKNVASQKLTVFAFDSTTNLPETGDAANLSAFVQKDDGSVTALADSSATEQDAANAQGYYTFDLAQGETDADKLLFSSKSSTANVVVIALPAVVYTVPPNFSAQAIDASGRVDVGKVAGTAQTARDLGANLDATVSSRLETSGYTAPDNAGITAIKAKTDNLPSDPADESLIVAAVNALQTHGDGAWATATGFSTLDEPGVRTAVGLAAANLDTQLASLSNLDVAVSSRLETSGYIAPDNTGIAAIKAKTDNLPADPASNAQVATRAAPGDAMVLTSGERTTLIAALFAFATEGTETFLGALRLMRAVLVGKSDGFPAGTKHFRDQADAKNRLTVTSDADGNRTAITTDAT